MEAIKISDETARVIPGGFYIKARKIEESEIAHAAPHVREIWDWLLKEANHKTLKTYGKNIERGQIFTDFSEIIEALHWREGFVKKAYKKHHVDNAMRWLRQRFMITTQKTTRGLIVTICNYDTYQNPKNYENANGYDTITTRLRQGTDTINKNVKNVKNENIDRGDESPKPKTFKQWTDSDFRSELSQHLEEYGKDTLNAFYKHWSEKSPKGKMKLQLENTWETKKRLDKWTTNSEKWKK